MEGNQHKELLPLSIPSLYFRVNPGLTLSAMKPPGAVEYDVKLGVNEKFSKFLVYNCS
jgi:hypothetical protein